MRSGSIIAETTKHAQRAVLAALGGAAFVVVALISEQSYFQKRQTEATQRLLTAHTLTRDIVDLQARMTETALKSATVGGQDWLAAYNKIHDKLDNALDKAATLADPDAAARFQSGTRASHERLAELDKAIIEAVQADKPAEAAQILSDPVYQYHQQIVEDGTIAFVNSIARKVEDDLRAVKRHEALALLMLLPIALFAGYVLIRNLNKSLAKQAGEHLAAEGKIQRLAMTDVLTGLANRVSLCSNLEAAIARARSNNTEVALLMIDLDRFKPVNDRHGHLVGDLVLKEVAKRLTKVVRAAELCGRFGGDEFVAVIEYKDGDQIPHRVGTRIVDSLSEPMTFQGLTVEIGASVGYARFPADSEDIDVLIGKADLALYQAKAAGRAAVCGFNASMDQNTKRRAELEADLKTAIAQRQIEPYYQPIIELASGTISGFEVLARWTHPKYGMLAPTEFIPIAERSGVIDELMLAVLQKACLDARQMPPHITLAVNVSSRQIQDERVAHKILAILSKTKFSPSRLEIELTESALVSDIETARDVIDVLKGFGIKVSLDDFGTGYSCLSYLSDLPFDKIKIDRSFVKTIHDRPESRKIVNAIVGLGKSLGIPTLAEGIESERDEAALRQMGCPYGQGYHYSRPVASMELDQIFARFSGKSEPQRARA